MARSPRSGFSPVGCLSLLAAVLLACVLLVGNGFLVAFILGAAIPRLPAAWNPARSAQAVMFLGPVLLLVVEWWAYDVLTDWIFPLHRRASRVSTADEPRSITAR